ncbi:hypothetical protein JB92DRAFT_3144424 [Gautieria morchelliformis]|nr:hypothetical protein JB92DRAFT_3144424 [Gautieria morchelliformis]
MAYTTPILRTTMNNRLPRELIDEIMGHVDEKDHISYYHLWACSLVCRFWLPSVQRLLFHHIKLPSIQHYAFNYYKNLPLTVPPERLSAQIQRLDQALLNSPHLRSYIRTLELPDLSTCGSSTCDDPSCPTSISIWKSLSPLLRKLTHVQKLQISGLTWSLLPGDLRQSLCQVLELPSMEILSISNGEFTCMDDFTNFINHARGLTDLTLTHLNTSAPVPASLLETKQGEDSLLFLLFLLIQFIVFGRRAQRKTVSTKPQSTEEDNEQRFERNRIHLTRLELRTGSDHSPFISWLLGPRSHLDISHIHTLRIGFFDTKDDSLNRLLRAIGSSLKHLFINIVLRFDTVPVVQLDLAFNMNIEILHVRATIKRNSLSTLGSVLSTINASNHIHNVGLYILPTGTVDWEAWETVYSVLAGPHFQFLRALYINIRSAWESDDSLVFLERSKDMVAGYPSLATRGVWVSSSDNSDDYCPLDC